MLKTPPLDGPASGPPLETHTPAAARPAPALRRVEAAMLLVAAVFFALHFIHLRADFPNHSFWQDWSKYTDEGWYGDAAIRHYQLGHWNVPGDFNPAAALPIWPALELILFRFTGVSLVAGRALTVVVFGLTLLACYALLRRWESQTNGPSLAPAMLVVLMAVSPFYFVFSRMAILEPLLILETVAALLVASAAGKATLHSSEPTPTSSKPTPTPIPSPAALWTVLLGLLIPLMVLTKTTALFLFPAVLWMLFAATGYRLRPALRVAALAAALGAAVWAAYFFLLVRPRYLADYHYLFDANANQTFAWKSLGDLLYNTLFDGIWIGRTLFALSLIAIVGVVIRLFAKGLRASPLPATMLLWLLGYGAFVAWRANLQPRYYLVLALPLTTLVVLTFEPLFVSAARTFQRYRPIPLAAPNPTQPTPQPTAVDTLLLRLAAAAIAAPLLFAAANGARQTLGFVLHPEYTWVDAAARLRDAVEREAAASLARNGSAHSRLVLSISGSDLSLITGLPSICDDFGTMTLDDRIAAYKPGWYAAWNQVEDDKMEALAPRYRLQRVLAVPAFDDPDRNLLILYRLDPLATPGPPLPPPPPRPRFTRRTVQTRMGKDPEPEPLER